MAVTLSHQSALDALRTLRSKGTSVHQMEAVHLVSPLAWVGKRLGAQNFKPDVWRWQQPSVNRPLHLLVPAKRQRMRGRGIVSHTLYSPLPAGSILWLDEHSSVVCPELLFLQMAESFSLPSLVMLGLELCGHFCRNADEPLVGDVTDGLPVATNVASLTLYLSKVSKAHGLLRAREALDCISDHAISAPEAVLATMYALPPKESGYGMGPISLNEHVAVDNTDSWVRAKSRYPDLMFGFAPVGINYDGSQHFDLASLMAAAEMFVRAGADEQNDARKALRMKLLEARDKVVDDNMRNRQLAAQGRIVFPATKEDLRSGRRLDALTRQILSCAHRVFGVDVGKYERTLDDTLLARDRWDLLDTLLPRGHYGQSAYGRL